MVSALLVFFLFRSPLSHLSLVMLAQETFLLPIILNEIKSRFIKRRLSLPVSFGSVLARPRLCTRDERLITIIVGKHRGLSLVAPFGPES